MFMRTSTAPLLAKSHPEFLTLFSWCTTERPDEQSISAKSDPFHLPHCLGLVLLFVAVHLTRIDYHTRPIPLIVLRIDKEACLEEFNPGRSISSRSVSSFRHHAKGTNGSIDI